MRIRELLYAFAAATLAFCPSVRAQEKPIVWTGPFVSGSLGAGTGTAHSGQAGDIRLGSVVGSIRGGYLQEYAQGWVVGAEIGVYPLSGLYGDRALNQAVDVQVQVNYLAFGDIVLGHTLGSRDQWLVYGTLGAGYGTARAITRIHAPGFAQSTVQTLSMPSLAAGLGLLYAVSDHMSIGPKFSMLYARPGHAVLNVQSYEMVIVYRF